MSTSDSSPGNPTAFHSATTLSPRWPRARRLFLVLAALATVVAIFYTVEDWRGKRAWEKYRREAEAGGENLDWNTYIPAPVPDDQNIFKAPMMTEWFVKQPGSSPPKPGPREAFALARPEGYKDLPVLVAEVQVTPSGETAAGEGAILRLDDPAARAQAEKRLLEAIGPCVEGAQSPLIVARPIEEIRPARFVVQASPPPTPKDIAAFFDRGNTLEGLPFSTTYLQVSATGSNAFKVFLKPPVYSAADYLAWTEPLVGNLNLLRSALQRPCARMDGDYQRPFESPIPNFLQVRIVAQTLAQRAQAFLLLGKPEAAWHELTLVRDMCRLLEAPPTGKPITLVAAMINVAVTGLYAQMIQEGLRLQAWREPQLAAIQDQLKHIDLLRQVSTAFFFEEVAICHTIQTTPSGELARLFYFGNANRNFWQRMQDPAFLAVALAPRGWLYQNMILGSRIDEQAISAIDITNQLIRPQSVFNQTMPAFSHSTPYNFLTRVAVPNFAKAIQTLARNQTLANEASIACALERYRLAHGQYPDSLSALVPQFIQPLPHDLINGEPLKYRRADRGGYLLYSIGWNEKDDGGVPGKTTTEGDWVWAGYSRY